MTPTSLAHLAVVDAPPAGSTDLETFPPSTVELAIAADCLTSPDRIAELVAVAGGRDRAEVLFTIAVWQWVSREVK